MFIENIRLNLDYEKLKVKYPEKVSLTGYILKNYQTFRQDEIRPAIIVCHGGGYGGMTETETTAIAMPFVAAGISAFVLKYSLAKDGAHYPSQFIELSESIKIVRKNSAKWHIDSNKIFVTGYSAGGHLAACAGTIWNCDIAKEYGYTNDINKANGMILGYPVISSKEENGHLGSFVNLLGDDFSNKELLSFLSLEDRVTKDTCPTFLMHTRDDDNVPVSHSLVFACALQKNDIPFEMHIYETGWHGMALANDRTAWTPGLEAPHCQDWIKKAVEWIKLM